MTGAARLLGLPVHPVAKAPDGGDLADQRWRVHQVRAAGLGPRALYVVTDHANSYGFRTALPVRRDLLDLAAREGVLLLEGNPYGLFPCPGRRLPIPKALHPDRPVIHLGSLSKTGFPGVRIDYAMADPRVEDGAHLADPPTRAKSMVTLGTALSAQAVTGGGCWNAGAAWRVPSSGRRPTHLSRRAARKPCAAPAVRRRRLPSVGTARSS